MKYKAVFFDLDGTLFDTSEGIYDTFDYVFKKYLKKVDRAEYPSFIGPPVRRSLERFFSKDEAEAAHDEFRVFYGRDAKFQAKLYDGIEDVLRLFRAAGLRIYTATSKNQRMSEELLEKFGILEYFDNVYGADFSAGRVEKTDVLRYALADSRENPGEALLIGDTVYDVEGALAVGIDCLAVTYGFGAERDLTGPRVIGRVSRPSGIAAALGF